MEEATAPQASTVVTASGDAKVSTASDPARVRLDFGGVAVFFAPADAILLGTQIISAAARLEA